MIWLPVRLPVAVSLVLAVCLAVPVYGDTVAPVKPEDGLTRDTLTESTSPPHAPAPAPAPVRTHTQRTRLNSKHFRSAHHTRRRRHHRKSPTQVVVAAPPRRRNPVVSFVYWWNGWVIKTFHTNVGTVMLGTVGAKT